MQNKPDFSVLMANYNNGKYIAEAIESVINQTFNNWELIVVDDCSTDNSVEIIKSYKDERIGFFRNEKNIGKIGVLKKAIALAQAEIIGILDSDDVLTENALEEIMEAYREHPECGFVYSQFVFCDDNFFSTRPGICKAIPRDSSNLFELCTVAFRTFKKEIYYQTSGYDDEILYAEDVDIILKMEEYTNFFFVDKILYKYRRTPNSQTLDTSKAIIGSVSRILAEYKAYLRRLKSEFPNLSQELISFKLFKACALSMKARNFRRAKRFFILAIKNFTFEGLKLFIKESIMYFQK